MQKIATQVFVYASVAFGILGILFIFSGPDNNPSQFHTFIQNLLWTSVFIILPSFALSVAGKYLSK
jgi:hypothetical protein